MATLNPRADSESGESHNALTRNQFSNPLLDDRHIHLLRLLEAFNALPIRSREAYNRSLHALSTMRSEGMSLHAAAREFDVDPRTVVRWVKTSLRKHKDERYSSKRSDNLSRFLASLAGSFGLLAALLAAVGLFGTVAQAIEERRRELGIRLALGATPGGLRRMAVRGVFASLALGLGLGAVAAAAASPMLTPWLYGVEPGDLRAWAGAAALLAAMALAASWLAAARIARVAPAESLRCD